MNLKCNKNDCKHNCKFACMANEVHIAKNTDCKTYEKDPNKSRADIAALKADMFELAPDMMAYSEGENVEIKCKANCLFNRNGLCNANGITVLEKKTDGICGTFIEN